MESSFSLIRCSKLGQKSSKSSYPYRGQSYSKCLSAPKTASILGSVPSPLCTKVTICHFYMKIIILIVNSSGSRENGISFGKSRLVSTLKSLHFRAAVSSLAPFSQNWYRDLAFLFYLLDLPAEFLYLSSRERFRTLGREAAQGKPASRMRIAELRKVR